MSKTATFVGSIQLPYVYITLKKPSLRVQCWETKVIPSRKHQKFKFFIPQCVRLPLQNTTIWLLQVLCNNIASQDHTRHRFRKLETLTYFTSCSVMRCSLTFLSFVNTLVKGSLPCSLKGSTVLHIIDFFPLRSTIQKCVRKKLPFVILIKHTTAEAD